MILVYHRTGPHRDMVLQRDPADATLPAALSDGSVMLTGGAVQLFPQVASPKLTELMVVGSGFVDGVTDVTIPGASVTGVTVTPTTVAFDTDLTGKSGLLQVKLTKPDMTLTLRVT